MKAKSPLAIFFYIVVGIIALLTGGCTKDPEPAYSPFVGEFTLGSDQKKVSIQPSDVGLLVFFDNEQLPYLSIVGSTLGAVRRLGPPVYLILTHTNKGIEYSLSGEGKVLSGTLVRLR